MVTTDFHMHTTFCDGKNTPEEMVMAAIEKGMKQVGISAHSYQFFDESYCIKKYKVKLFIDTVNELKQKYKDKIDIFCGVEQEYFSDFSAYGFDYVIGSVHYVKHNDNYLSVDDNENEFAENVKKYFDGDFYSYCEEYFSYVSDVYNKTKCNIIGHFDLVSKFNEGGRYFDENNPRYVKAYKNAIDNLVKYNVPFEVNTGAISRGYRKFPYPNNDMINYILSKGGKFVLSSDAHSCDAVGFMFDYCEKMLGEKGVYNPEFIM